MNRMQERELLAAIEGFKRASDPYMGLSPREVAAFMNAVKPTLMGIDKQFLASFSADKEMQASLRHLQKTMLPERALVEEMQRIMKSPEYAQIQRGFKEASFNVEVAQSFTDAILENNGEELKKIVGESEEVDEALSAIQEGKPIEELPKEMQDRVQVLIELYRGTAGIVIGFALLISCLTLVQNKAPGSANDALMTIVALIYYIVEKLKNSDADED